MQFDNSLILQPTALSQWYSLVDEAEAQCHYRMHQDVESYLVFLLMRFCQREEWVKSILALDFLQALKLQGNEGANKLQEVGDKSLLFSGLFPGIASRKRVSIRYFIEIGQSAYWQAGNLDFLYSGDLFHRLCDDFEKIKNILSAMRKLG